MCALPDLFSKGLPGIPLLPFYVNSVFVVSRKKERVFMEGYQYLSMIDGKSLPRPGCDWEGKTAIEMAGKPIM